jgi:hypothetical protein
MGPADGLGEHGAAGFTVGAVVAGRCFHRAPRFRVGRAASLDISTVRCRCIADSDVRAHLLRDLGRSHPISPTKSPKISPSPSPSPRS